MKATLFLVDRTLDTNLDELEGVMDELKSFLAQAEDHTPKMELCSPREAVCRVSVERAADELKYLEDCIKQLVSKVRKCREFIEESGLHDTVYNEQVVGSRQTMLMNRVTFNDGETLLFNQYQLK